MEKDWDNLIILDACRYDLFESMNTMDGDLKKVISAGSHTSEFLTTNFKGKQYRDTIYISATPMVEVHLEDDVFYMTIHLWDEEWDEEIGAVHPKTTTRRAIETANNYPDKRIITHYIQPHYPFIGPLGQKITNEIRPSPLGSNDGGYSSIWDQLESGDVEVDKVWEAYRENFEVLLPYVQELVEELIGRTIVTSDHGNSFGSFGVYGHPPKLYFDELVEVPWFISTSNDRKTLEEGDPFETDHTSDVKEKLQDLGYHD